MIKYMWVKRMKRFKILLLLIMVSLVSGCASKFQGTWCRFADVPSTLVILNYDISDEEMNNIIDYINSIPDLKRYDDIGKIEEASKMITIYYKSDEHVDEYQGHLGTLPGVRELKFINLNSPLDKLVVKRDTYIFDKDLNDFSVTEIKGSYQIDGNKITLNNNGNDLEFYYKNKFLCYDKNCDEILTKAKGSECVR